MSLVVATTRVNWTVDTGPYTQDITTADLGGLTPKAAIIEVVGADVDGTVDVHARYSKAFTDGTTHKCITIRTQDGVAASYVREQIDNDYIGFVISPSAATEEGVCTFDSWITNGIRIAMASSEEPADDFFITVTFFAGTDLSVDVGSISLGNTVQVVDVTTVGFQPDMVFHLGGDAAAFDYGGNILEVCHGVSSGGASPVDRCVMVSSIPNSATSANYQWTRTAALMAMLGNGNLDWYATTQDYDSSGFSYNVQSRGANTSDAAWLALNFNSAASAWVGTYTTPTSTGDHAITAPAFKPQIAGMLVSINPSIDTEADADNWVYGSLVFDADDEYCNTIADEDAVGTMNSQSLSDNQAVNVPDDTGAALLAGTFSTFDTNGWTLNYSAVDTGQSYVWGAWAIEEVVSGTSFFATAADSVGITDSLTKSVGRIKLLTNTVGITDVISKVGTFIKSLLESVGITDSISKIGTFTKSITDTIGITDTITKSVGRIVALANTVGVTDFINAFLQGAAKFASIADNVGITDVITKSVGRIVALANTVGITDTLSKVGTFIKGLTESVGITDVIATSVGRIVALADTVGITDIITAAVFKLVSLADAIGITDAISITGTYVRALAESIGIIDVISKTGTFIKAISDAVGITDIISTSVGFIVAIADSIGITDVITAIKGAAGYFVNLADTVGVTDSVSKVGTFIRTLQDTVGITDVLSTVGTFIRTFADNVGITDIVTTSVGRIVTLADTTGITDTISTVGTFIRTITDSIGITDTLSKIGTFIRNIPNSVGITDTLSTVGTFIRNISDAVGITDALSALKLVIVSLADAVGITDAVSIIKTQVTFIVVLIDSKLRLSRVIDRTLGLTRNVSKKLKLARYINRKLRL